MSSRLSTLLAGLFAVIAVGATTQAQARPGDDQQTPPSTAATPSSSESEPLSVPLADQFKLGLSNVVLRPEDQKILGAIDQSTRVMMLEHLRKMNVRAVGSENVLFGSDHSDEAERLLGGTIFDLECLALGNRLTKRINCRLGVEWQVFDPETEVVVYKARTYAAVYDHDPNDSEGMADSLLTGVIDVLLSRPGFGKIVVRPDDKLGPSKYAKASITACPAIGSPPEENAEASLDAVVVLRAPKGHGSGFMFSPDPFVLTAAHVARVPDLKAVLRDGSEHPISVIRLDREADVALVRIEGLGATPACLPVTSDLPRSGAAVFALGAPASQDLAFSITRGIVSGVREARGTEYVQTDASINPGNSGGPLVNERGQVVAIAQSKLAGFGVEGVAFGITSTEALGRLSITLDETSDAKLLQAVAVEAPKDAPVIVEPPMPRPPLDPVAEAERERKFREARFEAEERKREAIRQEKLDAITPAYIKVMRYAGGVAAAVGGVIVVGSYSTYDSERMSYGEFERARLMNDLGWLLAAAGGTSFVLSYTLAPKLPPEEAGAPASPAPASPASATPAPASPTRHDSAPESPPSGSVSLVFDGRLMVQGEF